MLFSTSFFSASSCSLRPAFSLERRKEREREREKKRGISGINAATAIYSDAKCNT